MNTDRARSLAKLLSDASACLIEMADALDVINKKMPMMDIDKSIDDVGFCVRTRRTLERLGIKTIGELIREPIEEHGVPIPESMTQDIDRVLAKMGYVHAPVTVRPGR